MNKQASILRLGALAIFVLALIGCSDKDNVDMDIDDDDVDAVVVPWTLYINYDDHPNVAARCDGTTRMYTTTRTDDPLQLVPDHNLCPADGDR